MKYAREQSNPRGRHEREEKREGLNEPHTRLVHVSVATPSASPMTTATRRAPARRDAISYWRLLFLLGHLTSAWCPARRLPRLSLGKKGNRGGGGGRRRRSGREGLVWEGGGKRAASEQRGRGCVPSPMRWKRRSSTEAATGRMLRVQPMATAWIARAIATRAARSWRRHATAASAWHRAKKGSQAPEQPRAALLLFSQPSYPTAAVLAGTTTPAQRRARLPGPRESNARQGRGGATKGRPGRPYWRSVKSRNQPDAAGHSSRMPSSTALPSALPMSSEVRGVWAGAAAGAEGGGGGDGGTVRRGAGGDVATKSMRGAGTAASGGPGRVWRAVCGDVPGSGRESGATQEEKRGTGWQYE